MITLKKFKAFLDMAPRAGIKDELLGDCIRAASAELSGLVNRELERKTRRESFNGSGNKFGYLMNYPVNSITTLQVISTDGFTDLFNPPDTIYDSLLIFDAGIIFLKKGYIFPAGEQNIYIEYESGYTCADEWAPGTNYQLCDLIIYNTVLYECVVEHVSGAEFQNHYWNESPLKPVPADIEKAVKYLGAKQFYDSPAGKNLLMKKAESTTAAYPKSAVYRDIEIEHIINKYRKLNI